MSALQTGSRHRAGWLPSTAKRRGCACQEGKAAASHLRVSKASPPCPFGKLRAAFIALLFLPLLPAFADPAPGGAKPPASGVSAPSVYVTVNDLGESDQQAAARDGQLLSHRRMADPFGFTIRGPFKGLPPAVENPATTPVKPAAAPAPPAATQGQPNSAQAAAAVNGPTLEKAVQELSIGAVNVGSHEFLIKSRSIREGDLLVLESGGRPFAVWVESVGVRGVFFCDTDLKKHILKPFGSGPKELPGDSALAISDVRNFLNKDARP